MVPALPPGVPVPLQDVTTLLLLELSVETVAAGFTSPRRQLDSAKIRKRS